MPKYHWRDFDFMTATDWGFLCCLVLDLVFGFLQFNTEYLNYWKCGEQCDQKYHRHHQGNICHIQHSIITHIWTTEELFNSQTPKMGWVKNESTFFFKVFRWNSYIATIHTSAYIFNSLMKDLGGGVLVSCCRGFFLFDCFQLKITPSTIQICCINLTKGRFKNLKKKWEGEEGQSAFQVNWATCNWPSASTSWEVMAGKIPINRISQKFFHSIDHHHDMLTLKNLNSLQNANKFD